MLSKGDKRVREIDNEEFETATNYSEITRSSRRSKSSNSTRRFEAAAEAAALRAKLKYIDLEAKTRAELEKLDTTRQIDLAEAKVGVLEVYDKQKAFSLREIDNALPKSSSKNIVGKYIDTCEKSQPTVEVKTDDIVEIAQPTSVVRTAVHLNPDTQEFEPKPTVGVYQENSACTSADQVSISRLPPPEPSVFHGDPLKYPGWKSAFQTLIEQRQIPANEKMHYLKNI